MRRVFWGREREWRRWWVRENRVGEERRAERRWWWWWISEKMEWVRSKSWGGVRIESEAMMVVVSSIMGSCALVSNALE